MVGDHVIKILTEFLRLMERGKVKCHKYWPKKAEEVQYWGAFQVKNTGETITEDHFIQQAFRSDPFVLSKIVDRKYEPLHADFFESHRKKNDFYVRLTKF